MNFPSELLSRPGARILSYALLTFSLPGCSAADDTTSDDQETGTEDGDNPTTTDGSTGGNPGGVPFDGTGGSASGGVSGVGGSFPSGMTGGTSSTGGSSSAGAGGTSDPGPAPPGLPCDEPFVADDFDGCLTTLSEIDTKFYPLPDGAIPERLAVYLHGDTAWEWYSNGSLITDVVAWAQPRNVVVAALLSPVTYSGRDPEDRAFGALNGSADVANIGGALDALVEAFGVSPSELLVWSTSGGSWFLTSSFFPRLGGRFQGDFAISCGASEFAFGFQWDPQTETDKREATDIWFNYGSEDFLAPGVDYSREHYLSEGFRVTETEYPGAGHCDHDIVEPTLTYWEGRWP